jgi:hypothetical protein
MVSSGLLRRVAILRTDVSEEPGASFIRVTKIGELGTTQAATSNRRTLRRNIVVFLFWGRVQRCLRLTNKLGGYSPYYIFCSYTRRVCKERKRR